MRKTLILTVMLLLALNLTSCIRQSDYDKLKEERDQYMRERDECRQQSESMKNEINELREQNRLLARRDSISSAELKKLQESFRDLIRAKKVELILIRGRVVVKLAEDILFDPGKTELKKEGRDVLERTAKILVETDRDWQVAGHTDNKPIRTAKFPSNWDLSSSRSLVVCKYLIEHGMSPLRLSASGFSEYYPIARNDDLEGRAKNRRIEIMLLPNLEGLYGDMIPRVVPPPYEPDSGKVVVKDTNKKEKNKKDKNKDKNKDKDKNDDDDDFGNN